MEDAPTHGRLHRALRADRPGKSTRLVALIRRYGAAIEADLAWRGIDLATEWRSRRWRRLLNLIDHLPRNSALTEAQVNDEEAATALLDTADQITGGESERWSEWSPERDALARIEDRLQEIARAVVASAGGKPGRFRPAERPSSAMQRLRQQRRRQEHQQLVARMLPHQQN